MIFTPAKRLVIGFITAVIVLLATPGVGTAAAPGSVITRVKSSKVVASSASKTYTASGFKTVVRIVANFTSHKKGSVKLTKFKICYSDSSGDSMLVTPMINVGGYRKWTGSTKRSGDGSCSSYYSVNKTFKGSPGKEMFVIQTNVGMTPNSFLHGYNR